MVTWEELTGEARFYKWQSGREAGSGSDGFSEFQQDSQRILYSSAFRRMQGKTQVHPFPSDFVRNRLTHTLEVAHIGRAIATRAAHALKARYPSIDPSVWGEIVYAACLMHDIGNPPFGHVGEYAIRSWFAENAAEPRLAKLFADPEKKGEDLLGFEGNAQGFRIATRLVGWKDRGGLRLTNAVLASFMKYPFSSEYRMDLRHGDTEPSSKYGFCRVDADNARQVFEAVGLAPVKKDNYVRHPFAYIVEAADDICYRTTDIEDAYRSRHIMFQTAEDALYPIGNFGKILENYNTIKDSEPEDKVAYLRSGAIVRLSQIAVERFVEGEKRFRDNTWSGGDLIDAPDVQSAIEFIKGVCKKQIYKERRKLETESAGITILSYLLDQFGTVAAKIAINEKLLTRDRHIFDLLPPNYQNALTDSRNNIYGAMTTITDYVSGMTDRYAHEVFLKLNGTSPVLGRMM